MSLIPSISSINISCTHQSKVKRLNLAGAHTIGETHCDAITKRLYNFNGEGGADPSFDAYICRLLEDQVPQPTRPCNYCFHGSWEPFAPSTLPLLWKSPSKQRSLPIRCSASHPCRFRHHRLLQEPEHFFFEFAQQMKMGAIEVLEQYRGGGIRKKCRLVNS